ncbi:MAG: tetratricopeptide repeat protein, partial [Verrucomicrobiae bacterium]|nr:tetratricopeptide repeat protein [Verrucomicrobiae bacterium]
LPALLAATLLTSQVQIFAQDEPDPADPFAAERARLQEILRGETGGDPQPEKAEEPKEEEGPLDAIRKLFNSGKYDQVVEELEANEELQLFFTEAEELLVKSLVARGKYEDAIQALQFSNRISATMRGAYYQWEIHMRLGNKQYADQLLFRLANLDYVPEEPGDILAVGQVKFLRGMEPKDVLDTYFTKVIKKFPDNPEGYLYAGRLALDKYDARLASRRFYEGLKVDPNNIELKYALAKAFFQSDRGEALKIIDEILALNPNHVPTLFLMVEHLLVEDNREKAEELLGRIEDVNPRDVKLWAMRAGLEFVEGDKTKGEEFREQALADWRNNPEVDFVIGSLLAQKLRSEEAVTFLRSALEMDKDYLPADLELAQSLLRTGDEEEAWERLERLAEVDPYNVPVYNLLTLYDEMKKFVILRRGNFVLRMDPKEADLFGDSILDLLERASKEMHDKYGFKPRKNVLIECFPNQADFAIRTFGVQGGDGFLGVCFGYVITMNSPGSLGSKLSNWEVTLWHEYAHTVTLDVSKMRVPRWFTEGISVHEEGHLNPAYKRRLTSDYRKAILGEFPANMRPPGAGDDDSDTALMKLPDLNRGFTRPESEWQIMFAYFQSSMLIDYLVDKHGYEFIQKVLADLGEGVPFPKAMADNGEPLGELEVAFFKHAKELAKGVGPDLDWGLLQPEVADSSTEDLKKYVEENPKKYYARMLLAKNLLDAEEAEEAKVLLQAIIADYPDNSEADSPYWHLARAHRLLGEQDKEREALSNVMKRTSDASQAVYRLLSMEAAAENWEEVLYWSDRVLAVNPYIKRAQLSRATSLEKLGRPDEAIENYQRILAMGADNPSQIHYRLAILLRESDAITAKRHVLDSLIGSPRFREAHKLLLEMADQPSS